MTVLENLEMGAFTRKDSKAIREDVDRVYELFPRLKEREKQKGGTMSGGEQQMLAMGRALMAHPEAPAPRRAVARPRPGDRRQDLRDHPRDQRAGHDDPARRAERELRARRLARAATCSRPARSPCPTNPTRCATTSASRPPTWGRDHDPCRSSAPKPSTSSTCGCCPRSPSSWLSNYKGYGEKVGLGTGLLTSFVGVIIWLLWPAKRDSKWAARRRGEDPDKVTTA